MHTAHHTGTGICTAHSTALFIMRCIIIQLLIVDVFPPRHININSVRPLHHTRTVYIWFPYSYVVRGYVSTTVPVRVLRVPGTAFQVLVTQIGDRPLFDDNYRTLDFGALDEAEIIPGKCSDTRSQKPEESRYLPPCYSAVLCHNITVTVMPQLHDRHTRTGTCACWGIANYRRVSVSVN
jgi:hypothetical protein